MDELILISQIYGNGTEMADMLKAGDFDSLEKISQAEASSLASSLNIGNKEAEGIIQIAVQLLSEKTGATDRLSFEGVEESISEKLWQAGFKTTESIASVIPEVISDKCQIPLALCEKIVAAAHDKNILIHEADDMLEKKPGSARGAAVPREAWERDAEITDSPQLTTDTQEEEPRVIRFRRYLARMIVRELFD